MTLLKKEVVPKISEQKQTVSVEVNPSPTQVTKLSEHERTPSDWNVEKTETGIIARHRITNKVFTGTVREFNIALRG